MLGNRFVAWAIDAAKKQHVHRPRYCGTPDEEDLPRWQKYGTRSAISRTFGELQRAAATSGALTPQSQWLKKNENYIPDAVVLLQTTNPLRRPEDLDSAIEQFKKSGVDSTMTVCKALGNHNPGWMLVKDEARGARACSMALIYGPFQARRNLGCSEMLFPQRYCLCF